MKIVIIGLGSFGRAILRSISSKVIEEKYDTPLKNLTIKKTV